MITGFFSPPIVRRGWNVMVHRVLFFLSSNTLITDTLGDMGEINILFPGGASRSHSRSARLGRVV